MSSNRSKSLNGKPKQKATSEHNLTNEIPK